VCKSIKKPQNLYSRTHTSLFIVRHVGTARLDTRVEDTLVSTRSTRLTCRVVTSQVEFGLCRIVQVGFTPCRTPIPCIAVSQLIIWKNYYELKCTKFNFGFGSAPDPAGRAYSGSTENAGPEKGGPKRERVETEEPQLLINKAVHSYTRS